VIAGNGEEGESVMAKKRIQRKPKKLSIDVVEARAISLVDGSGAERVSLSCSDEDGGFAVIHINDGKGRPSLTIQVDDRGHPSICLFNQDNSPGISLVVNNERGNGMSIADPSGQPCIILGAPGPESDDPRSPHPDFTVVDRHGQRVWSVFEGQRQIQSSASH
jgi:hypothetical protein